MKAETSDQEVIGVKLRAQEWAKVGGMFVLAIGTGVGTWVKTTSAIDGLIVRTTALEVAAEKDRGTVDALRDNITASLNAISRDIGYMRGLLEQRGSGK